ncbi:MAG: CPBP family intramembrane glutamic endopeptidase [Acidobacteriota bacterium]
MTTPFTVDPAPIRATALLHQEGILAVVAAVGLFFRGQGPMTALLPRTSWIEALGAGVITGAAALAVMGLLLLVPVVKDLERWQAGMVHGWTMLDSIAVAVFSGLAEEALIRALLQPWIGLVAAAVLFALLHIVPDRRLWVWPVIALVLGLVFGLVFERWGYPAAAVAHIVVNMVSLLRLRRKDNVRTTAASDSGSADC